MITAIGLLAAFCTTVAFLPQVIQTWRTRSTKDLSLPMFSIFTTGIFLWLVYG
ncbi:MAG: SemiSWEET transporter, partial [Terriglobia bacterium]